MESTAEARASALSDKRPRGKTIVLITHPGQVPEHLKDAEHGTHV